VERELAEEVVQLLQRAIALHHEAFSAVDAAAEDDELHRLKRRLADLIAFPHLGILRHIYHQYPDLAPDGLREDGHAEEPPPDFWPVPS
jgi:hypothetical protein